LLISAAKIDTEVCMFPSNSAQVWCMVYYGLLFYFIICWLSVISTF